MLCDASFILHHAFGTGGEGSFGRRDQWDVNQIETLDVAE